jgi:hypothetical protein
MTRMAILLNCDKSGNRKTSLKRKDALKYLFMNQSNELSNNESHSCSWVFVAGTLCMNWLSGIHHVEC